MQKPWILNSISKDDVKHLFGCFDESWHEDFVRVDTSKINHQALSFWLLYQPEVCVNHLMFYGNKPENIVKASAQKIYLRFKSYFSSEELGSSLQNLFLRLIQSNVPNKSTKEQRAVINEKLKEARQSGLMWNSASAAKLAFEHFDIQLVVNKADFASLKARLIRFVDELNEEWEDRVIIEGKDVLLDPKLGLKRFNQKRPRLLYGELYRSVYAHSLDFTRPYQAKVLECLFDALDSNNYHDMPRVAEIIQDELKTVKNSVSEINKLTQECVELDAVLYAHKGLGTSDNAIYLNPALECVRVATERSRRKQEIKAIIK